MSDQSKRLRKERKRAEREIAWQEAEEAQASCRKYHDGCDGCGCECHIPLKPSEIWKLRELLEERQ